MRLHRQSIRFIAPWNHASGLGEAARGALKALWQLGENWQVEADAVQHWGPHERIGPHLNLQRNDSPRRSADVCWLHMNPDAACHSLTAEQKQDLHRSRSVVATWVWESQQLPPSWHQALHWLDQLWVPSGYVKSLLQPYTNKPVRVIPHVVDLPDNPESLLSLTRQRRILYVFDGASYLHRKNPDVLLEAFARSGLAQSGWQLLLKTRNLGVSGSDPHHVRMLLERLNSVQQQQPGSVELLDAPITPQELRTLMRTSAIYCSPHASEGFGLTIAEAMAQGCLVVATDHGGSRDWLSPQTGLPVRCDLQCLERGYGPYPAGSVWAKVDPIPLAQALQQAAHLHDQQPDCALTLRRAAQAAINAHCSLTSVSAAIRAALP